LCWRRQSRRILFWWGIKMRSLLMRLFYRRLMRFAHRHNWHHLSILRMECGDTQYWCHFCGIRVVLRRNHLDGAKILEDARLPRNEIIIVNNTEAWAPEAKMAASPDTAKRPEALS
jgi:hypothetical protein